MQADLISINHAKPRVMAPITGGIVREFVCGRDDDGLLVPGWCDMRAPYHIWKHRADVQFSAYPWPIPPIIGFHGYRKHINFRDPMEFHSTQVAPGWTAVALSTFRNYQAWLVSEMTGHKLTDLLEDADILTVKPFDCSYNGSMEEDYRASRSPADWAVFKDVMKAHGDFDFSTPFIRPMHFVCEDIVFFRWLRFFEEVRKDLEPLVKSPDNDDPKYRARALAFLAERMWSLWLDTSGFRIKEFPLMICWDA